MRATPYEDVLLLPVSPFGIEWQIQEDIGVVDILPSWPHLPNGVTCLEETGGITSCPAGSGGLKTRPNICIYGLGGEP